MDVRTGPQRRQSTKDLMLSNCCAGEDSWESLGQQGDQTSQSKRKSILNILWTDSCWSSNILTTWCRELTHWTRPWLWKRLRAGGEGGDRVEMGLNGITDSMVMSLSKLREIVKDREAWCAAVHGLTKSWTWLSDLTTSDCYVPFVLSHIFEWKFGLSYLIII